jgi:predicted porin
MKKLALSVAVAALAATGVQAKTVYSDDSMKLDITGEVAFELIRDVVEDAKTQNKTDNVDLEAKATYTLDNGVDVFGYYAFEFASWTEEQSSAKDLLKDHYVGFKKDALTVQYGDQDYAVDDFGIRKNLDAKTATEFVLNPDDSEMKGSAEVLLVKYKGDGFYVSASYDLDLENSTPETGFDIFAKAEVVDGVTVGATYSLQDYDASGDYAAYGVQVEYSGVDNLTLGASYVYGENYSQKEMADNEASGVDLAAKYKLTDAITVAGGIGFTMPESDSYDDLTIFYVNGNYNFTKNVDAYGEVYGEDDDQLGFVVGLSVDF